MRPGRSIILSWHTLGLAAVAAMCAGCAQANLTSQSPAAAPLTTGNTTAPVKGHYTLSAAEQKFDCKQLTGRMQVRILEIRDYNQRNNTTLAARTLQSGSTAVFGGPKAGTDPDGTYATDRAMLEAYNAQLVAKGCKAFDLDSQLQPQDVRVTPSATVKPPSKTGK